MEVSSCLGAPENFVLDEKTGLNVRRLTHDEQFSLYLAAIQPGRTLPAHYHSEGIEAYHIVDGRGEIELGVLTVGDVEWSTRREITTGDCFSIKPGQVHRLKNSGDGTLRIVFSAPPSHLGEDRVFVPAPAGRPR